MNGIAWGAVKADRASDWKDAVRIAMNAENIVDMLDKGIVEFAYVNDKGETREAVGTRNADLLASKGVKPLNAIDKTAKAVTYFDEDRQAIRSFVPARVLTARQK